MIRSQLVTFALLLVPFSQQSGGPAESARKPLARVEHGEAIVESGAALAEVVSSLAPAAKRHVLFDRAAAPKLQATGVQCSETLRVPAERTADLLDQLVLANGFAFIAPAASDLPWRLVDIKGPDRAQLRAGAMTIKPEEVEKYARSAQLVSVVFPLRHVNAREASASLRPFFPDNQLETISNVGNANQLLVTGFGPTVAQILPMLRELDQPPGEEAMAARAAAESAGIRALEKRVAELEKQVEALKKALETTGK